MGVVLDRTTTLMLVPDRVPSPKLLYLMLELDTTIYIMLVPDMMTVSLMRVPDRRISLMLILTVIGWVR
jgi:hypothetical protein